MFASAREARAFDAWLDEHLDEIRAAAEARTRTGRLQDIERYSASRILFTRFNYTTGDAAGQNLTGKATQAACRWILEHHDGIERYLLESLIVATYGGGTGLATQREFLELLGCYGGDRVGKFAEIVAATVLCGELSLGSAVVAEEWVDAHDAHGRNRP